MVKPLVIAGPSGVGKGTLLVKLRESFPCAFGYSVSHTSREPRPGEEHGVHYYFVARESFLQGVAERKFLEYANNFGDLYGTSYSEIERNQRLGKICLLEVDIQGVKQIKESAIGSEMNYIFISPPSIGELERRLRRRGTEQEEKIKHRLEVAVNEMAESQNMNFDRILINNDLESCFQQLKSEIVQWYPFLQ